MDVELDRTTIYYALYMYIYSVVFELTVWG